MCVLFIGLVQPTVLDPEVQSGGLALLCVGPEALPEGHEHLYAGAGRKRLPCSYAIFRP